MSRKQRYPKGTRWKVVAEGVTWSGLKPVPGGAMGAGGDLPVGSIITSRGPVNGWGGDAGYGIRWDIDGVVGIGDIMVFPIVGTAFNSRPADGLLEEVS